MNISSGYLRSVRNCEFFIKRLRLRLTAHFKIKVQKECNTQNFVSFELNFEDFQIRVLPTDFENVKLLLVLNWKLGIFYTNPAGCV